MGLLDSLLTDSNNQIVDQLAKNFGIDPAVAEKAIKGLVPALSRGMQQKMQDPSGLDAMLEALKNGNHTTYVNSPDKLGAPAAIDDGNSILGHIFGNKDVSRNVAAHAARNTGLDTQLLKKMLPVLATVAMGMIRKQSHASGGLTRSMQSSSGRSGMGGLLTSFLDADHDGSITDDILKMAIKLF